MKEIVLYTLFVPPNGITKKCDIFDILFLYASGVTRCKKDQNKVAMGVVPFRIKRNSSYSYSSNRSVYEYAYPNRKFDLDLSHYPIF